MMLTPGKVAADLVPKIINVSGNGKSVPGRPLSRSALESVEGRHHQMGKIPMLHVTPMEDPLVTPSWWPIQHDPTVEDLIRKLLWNMLKLFKSFKAFQSLLNILETYFSGWVPDSGQDSHQVLSEVYPWRRLAHTWCNLCCRFDAPRMMGTILLSFTLDQLLGWILCYVMAPSLTSQHWREEKSKYIDDDGNVIKMPGADYADCCHGCSLALCSVANAREPLSVEFDNSSSVAE